MRRRAPLIFAFLVAASLLAAPGSQAQDQDQTQAPPAPQAQPDAQATGVGRVSLIQGNVSTQRGDSGDWNAATVNTPVVPGDRVSTGERSRAEVQLDFANIVRLDERTVIRVADLVPHRIQIELSEGLMSFASFPNSDSDVEIDTPNLAIHPQPAAAGGLYRIQVNADGDTLVVVRRGQAEVGTTEGSTMLQPGQLITVHGDATSAQYKITASPARDAFDQWNEDRDRLLQSAQSSQPLNPYYQGGADLNQYGTWQNVPDYGQVWTPSNVPPDWAPYRDGSWVWEPYWGWTWVSYEPWGWAPYHYGRWFPWNGSWAWWPGPVYPYYRPLWAPAYVSFFGFGPHFGVGFGFGSFGWIPIGPADPFFPGWGGFGVSFNFFRFGDHDRFRDGFRGGRGFIAPLAGPLHGRAAYSNLNGLETNARLRAGITSVSASRFGNGRVVPERHNFTAEEIHSAQFARGGLPVAPSRSSLSATGRSAAAGTVPSRNLSAQRFVSHTQPSAAPHSFAAESAQIRQQIERQRSSPAGRPSPGGAGRPSNSPRSSLTPQESPALGRSQPSQAGQGNGFRSFESSRGAAGSAANEPAARGNGWQRFTPQQGQPAAGQPAYSRSRGPVSGSQSSQNSQRYQSRPSLDLHHSIVQQRSPSYGSPRTPYSGGANSYYSAPRSQPSYRSPEPPRGYSAAPHYSAPSAGRGGSSSSGGGGAYRGGGGTRGGGSSGGSHGGGGGHGRP
jgi:hypothetical protein